MTARVTRSPKGRSNYLKKGSNNVICDRTGFKIKSDEGMYEWNGLFVRKESFERRQPQDLIRGFPDRQQPEVSRPGGDDVFLSIGDVTADDL